VHCKYCNYIIPDRLLRTKKVLCAHCGRSNPYLVKLKKQAVKTLPGGRMKVIDCWNPEPRKGKVQFAFESFDHPGVRALAEEYGHAEAMADQPDEIHAQLALLNWLNRHLLSGGPMIRVYQKGRWRKAFSKGFDRELLDTDCQACSGFSFRFIMLASSVGHVARQVNIFSEDTPYDKFTFAHMIVEIWSNQYVKWVAMDPLFNHSWWKDGVPLSCLEIRDEFFKNHGKAVDTHWGLSNRRFPRVEDVGPTAGSPTKFQWVLYYKANNFVAFPVRQKFWRALVYRDNYNEGRPVTTYPGGTRKPYAGELLLDESSDRDDFDWPVNLTEMNLTCSKPGFLEAHLYTYTPNLSHFQVRKSGRKSEQSDYEIKWRLRPGRNRLSVCAVNSMGVRGPESFVELEWTES